MVVLVRSPSAITLMVLALMCVGSTKGFIGRPATVSGTVGKRPRFRGSALGRANRGREDNNKPRLSFIGEKMVSFFSYLVGATGDAEEKALTGTGAPVVLDAAAAATGAASVTTTDKMNAAERAAGTPPATSADLAAATALAQSAQAKLQEGEREPEPSKEDDDRETSLLESIDDTSIDVAI
ncbi:unnamed protein product [Amoebophrya sp. A120]|nr:unnamed protein product [Amoebophrya sp. A120]|eukprot:GSA120T00011242001.1